MERDFTLTSIQRFLSVDELAILLGVSKTTVYRIVEKRALPFYKIGGSLRFKESDVMEYIEQQRVGSSIELL